MIGILYVISVTITIENSVFTLSPFSSFSKKKENGLIIVKALNFSSKFERSFWGKDINI